MLEIFNRISSNLDIINATNNSIIIPLFLIAIFVKWKFLGENNGNKNSIYQTSWFF